MRLQVEGAGRDVQALTRLQVSLKPYREERVIVLADAAALDARLAALM